MKRVYPQADRVVCVNGIDKSKIPNIDAELYFQTHTPDIEYQPKAEMWKMYPARMRIDSHEIVMDNDLIIFNRVPEIDRFVSGDFTLMLRGRSRRYGKYDHLVPMPHAINSGLYGMPPNFNLALSIKDACAGDTIREWTEWCDDQGIIAYSLFKHNHIIIEPETIFNYFSEYNLSSLPSNLSGVHFIGSNRGAHGNWRKLISPFTLLI
jgi:hypothetical protein